MKFSKRFFLAATAACLTIFLSIAGNAQVQQNGQNDGQNRRIHLHHSEQQLPDELVCELIDDFTSRYSEQLACRTDDCQPVRQRGRHHSRSKACRNACQRAARSTCKQTCTQNESCRTECAIAHSCTAPQEYEAGWVAFTDADDTTEGQVKVLCRRCQVQGCDFLEKKWEVTP